MKVASILAFSATTYAVAFNGPQPTPSVVDRIADIHGWTPKPTDVSQSLLELFRRQGKDDAMCGYIEGDAQFPVSCTTGSCFHATSLSWFGCCTGTAADSCNIATRCIASASVDSCLSDPSCYNDQYVTACTEDGAPFCAKLYSTAGQQTESHLVCVATATSVEVLASASGSASSVMLNSASASARSSISGGGDVNEVNTRSTTGAAGGGAGLIAGATSSRLMAGAAIQTAKAVAGAAAGGLAGVFALLF